MMAYNDDTDKALDQLLKEKEQEKLNPPKQPDAYEQRMGALENMMKQTEGTRAEAIDRAERMQRFYANAMPAPVAGVGHIMTGSQPFNAYKEMAEPLVNSYNYRAGAEQQNYQNVLDKYKTIAETERARKLAGMENVKAILAAKQLEAEARKTKNDEARLDIQQRAEDRKNRIEEAKLDIERSKLEKEKQPTDLQSQSALYAKRLEQSEKVFEDLEKQKFNRADLKTSLKSNLPEAIKPSQLKQQEQAERNFVNAILRRESGAAIAKSEFENAEKQYFPRVGDSPEVIEQKRQNRILAMEGLKQSAGKAYGKLSLPEAKPIPKAPGKNILDNLNPIKSALAEDGDKIKVMYQGKQLIIPRNRLNEAIKDGAEVIK